MPPKKTLEENMDQIQAKLNELAAEQDAGQKGKIRSAINNIKMRFRRYTDAKQKKELDKRLSKLLEDEKNKNDKSPPAKEKRKKIKELINILRKGQSESMDAPPQSEAGTPEDIEQKVPLKGFESKTPTPDPSSASSSGSATPQEDQPLLQKEEKEEKRRPGRPRKQRNPVGRPSNVQQMEEAVKKEKEQKENLELLMDAGVVPDLAGEINKILGQPTEQLKKQIDQRKDQQVQKTKETKERKQQERQQQEKQQQQQQKQQEEAQLIQTVRESTQLTDNVNKAEEQGSNTQIITPDYLLRDRPRVEIVESKYGVPAPNQRPQINELLNSEVETVPDVININQNQIGINERTTRQIQQDKRFEEDELGYSYQRTRRNFEKKRAKFRKEFDEPYNEYIDEQKKLNNPSSSSSNPDNSNYENNTDDKRNIMIEYARELELNDNQIQEITNMKPSRIDEIYDEYLDDKEIGYTGDDDFTEDDAHREYVDRFATITEDPQRPSHEQQLSNRVSAYKRGRSGRGLLSGLADSELRELGHSVGQRLGQIGAGAQSGAIAGARQRMQGGLREGFEGGLEGAVRGGVAAGIAGQFGGGLAGQLAQMGGQQAITDILGRIRGLVSGDGEDDDEGGDGGDEIKRQIDNMNQELGAIRDPLKYPEFKEKEVYRFPGPAEEKKGVQLVQNSITEYLNDVNLYGGGYEYEPILDL